MKFRSLPFLPAIIIILLGFSEQARGQGLSNSDFSDGLNGWVVSESGGNSSPGSVSVVDDQAQLVEGDSFLVTLQQTFTAPEFPGMLAFDVLPTPGFDATDSFIPDAFEVSLLNPSSASVVPAWKSGATSFFNLQEDGQVHLGSSTTFDGTTVTLDLRGLSGGAEVTLSFDLIGGDSDTAGGIRIDSVSALELQSRAVPVDIKPTSCPNPLRVREKGTVSIAILGTNDLDVTQIESASIFVEGLPPTSARLEDLTAPFIPFTGKTDSLDCNTDGPDGILDLRLDFDAADLLNALGPVNKGDVITLSLTGVLLDNGIRYPIVGEDVVIIQ